jgi:HSP20 family molecular chaperone IbpA
MNLQSTFRNLTRRDREAAPERVHQPPRAFVAPRVDVYENADELLIVADVPGATSDSVRVEIDKGELLLEAKRVAPAYDYRRVFSVPSGIDASKIEATLSSGVLHVKLPKSDALKPRRIQVKSA